MAADHYNYIVESQRISAFSWPIYFYTTAPFGLPNNCFMRGINAFDIFLDS